MSLSLEATSVFNALLSQYARTIAHEANNLLFLHEIRERTGKGAQGDAGTGLHVIRRQARAMGLALIADARPRVIKAGELASDVLEAITTQTSLRNQLGWQVAPGIATASVRERPAQTQMLLHHVIETVMRSWGPENDDVVLAVDWTSGSAGVEVRFTPLMGRPLPEPSALTRELALLNDFELALADDGTSLTLTMTDGA